MTEQEIKKFREDTKKALAKSKEKFVSDDSDCRTCHYCHKRVYKDYSCNVNINVAGKFIPRNVCLECKGKYHTKKRARMPIG